MRPDPAPRALDQTNATLQQLGYLPIDAPRLRALREALPGYSAWLADCSTAGRDSPSWSSLRAAQFSVSQPCAEALARAGLLVPVGARTIQALVADAGVCRALARIYKAPTLDPLDTDLLLVRKALAGQARPPSAAPAAPPAAASPAPQQRAPWPVHKIHGARFAVAVEHTTSRDGRAVLQIEAAERLPMSRSWDWPAKLAVQLKDHEIVEFWSVLQGRSPRAQFAHHGTNRDKSVELVAQPQTKSFMLALRQAGIARAVPVPASHAFKLSTLALQVLVANSPGLTASDVLALMAATPFSSTAE